MQAIIDDDLTDEPVLPAPAVMTHAPSRMATALRMLALGGLFSLYGNAAYAVCWEENPLWAADANACITECCNPRSDALQAQMDTPEEVGCWSLVQVNCNSNCNSHTTKFEDFDACLGPNPPQTDPTPAPTYTPTPSASPTPTPSNSPPPTPTPSFSPTPSPSFSPTPSPTNTPTPTPVSPTPTPPGCV